MAQPARGPHHCAAAASSTIETIFRYLQSRCTAQGGSLSPADIEAARAHLVQSLPKAFGFFETVNQRCMDASGSTMPALFARENILGSLLTACGQKAARTAFPNQITRFGAPWLDQFFGGLAQFVRDNICASADDRLAKLYATAAVKFGVNLSVNDLLQDADTCAVLNECLAPLLARDAPAAVSARLSDAVSLFIATRRGIPKPDISKVTEQEMRAFLTWLPPQVQLALGNAAMAATIGARAEPNPIPA